MSPRPQAYRAKDGTRDSAHPNEAHPKDTRGAVMAGETRSEHTETPRERHRRREAEYQAQRDAERAEWLAGHPDRPALLALNLATEVFVASDGYPATAIHTNQQAADILLASDWFAQAIADAETRGARRGWDAYVASCEADGDYSHYRSDEPE